MAVYTPLDFFFQFNLNYVIDEIDRNWNEEDSPILLGWNIWSNCQFLFSESFQLLKGQGKIHLKMLY